MFSVPIIKMEYGKHRVIISPMSLDGWWVFVSAWQREKEMDTAVAVEDKTTTPERKNYPGKKQQPLPPSPLLSLL